MGVVYGGNALIPAPLVSFRKRYVPTEDGTIIGSVYDITLHGKLVAWKGSPNSQGQWWTGGLGSAPPDEVIDDAHRLGALERKQEALRILFATEGQTLEIFPISPDSSPPISCNPRIKEINIPEGMWYNDAEYTITMEADVLLGQLVGSGEDNFGGFLIDKAQEDWSLEPADEIGRTYRLTHTLSAVGKRSYNTEGALIKGGTWQNAQAWVNARMGIDSTRLNQSSILSLMDPSNYDNAGYTPNPQAYNFIRSQHVNEMAGTFAVTETWLVFDATGLAAPAIEEFNVQTRVDESRRTTVSIEGTVRGLEVRNNTTHQLQSTRYTNALAYFNSISSSMLGRAQSYSGVILNPTPVQLSNGKNDVSGTITYNAEYNNRPASVVLGSISEHISVSFENPEDIVAQQVVIGRPFGPVIQPIGSVTAKSKTLRIEAQMPAATFGGPVIAMPATDLYVALQIPFPSLVVWVQKDLPEFDVISGRYSRTVTWGYE